MEDAPESVARLHQREQVEVSAARVPTSLNSPSDCSLGLVRPGVVERSDVQLNAPAGCHQLLVLLVS